MVHYILKLFFVCFSASKFGKVIGFSLALGREKNIKPNTVWKRRKCKGVYNVHTYWNSIFQYCECYLCKDAPDSLDMTR